MPGDVSVEREPCLIGREPRTLMSPHQGRIERGTPPGLPICFIYLGESKRSFGVFANQTFAIQTIPGLVIQSNSRSESRLRRIGRPPATWKFTQTRHA